MKKILVIEDHPSITMSVNFMLNNIIPGVIVDEASNFPMALRYLTNQVFDFIILDIDIPGGRHLGMVQKIRELHPKAPILIYTGYDESLYALPYVSAGANGFLSKSATEKDFRAAVANLLEGKQYLSNAVQEHLLAVLASNGRDVLDPLNRLTDREVEIMSLVLKGLSSKEICSLTDLKMSTVSTFKLNIFRKLDVTNAIDLYKKVSLLTEGRMYP